ncbi:Pyridoxamine 5'-phosphate oxidase [Vibrio aerogenes CECT 7868]|uniref:Pyridoxamine 5'-phosphate oxidase n=1 Tax=Vibrio aerogenes CECT 7868 TaxID=1216006 RepID=A0A1M5ZSU3_9VIBR|nr:heme utilization protein HutZ [Vibrio aerogenes]SHI27166.1 Pyridoxamine 5'-phosphate oxidase [Vibrio aerogenes CECT 7868]
MDTQEKQHRLQQRLVPEIQEFRSRCQTLQLATTDEQHDPHVSYAPFVYNEAGYFVLISLVARHARNLQVNPQLSMMMIEDETSSKLLYARKRLTFSATASLVERDSPLWERVISQLNERFGNIIENLSQMKDFKLYQLTTAQGLYVKGFGQAYQVSDDDLIDLVHLDQGHQPMKALKDFPELSKPE